VSEAVAAVLVYAVGVALSPIPVIAVILVLFSTRAGINGPVFLASWAGGLAALVTVVHRMADQLDAGAGGSGDDGIAWLRVMVGTVLLIAAAKKWRQRPDPGAEPSLPGWMARIEGFGPARTLGVGLLLSLNPKNLALAFGAGSSLAQLEVPARQAAAAIVVFALVGSAAVIAAVGYATFGGSGVRQQLEEAKTWLTLHNGALLAVLYLVFGTLLVSRGLGSGI
jgi:hypothetical protein